MNGAKRLNPSIRLRTGCFERLRTGCFERLERTDPRDEQSVRLKLSYAAFDVSSNSTFNRAPSAAATLSSVVNE
jgi:hypothetical protein